jgi:hypothetical protein
VTDGQVIATARGLVCGPNLLGTFRKAGVMGGKVLRGTKSTDLPIERPTKFELLVKSRTSKAFRTSVLLRADKVIK